jgi:biotin-(acetyl-CoA carboxylase) ligase
MEKNLFAALEEYLTYVNEQPDLLKFQYHSCLLGMNKEQSFFIKKNNETLKGTIIGVSDKGELIVKSSDDDQSLYFQHGDLIYL